MGGIENPPSIIDREIKGAFPQAADGSKAKDCKRSLFIPQATVEERTLLLNT